MDKLVNVGLIGFGIGGQVFHAPLISCVKGLHLKKIRAVKEQQRSVASSKYPDAELVVTPEEIFDDPSIDLVVISTPNTSHYALGKAALLAGKNVVLDKPFTINTADADDLIALSIKENKLLTVYHNRRFDSDFTTLQKVIKSDLLGRLVEFESRYDRFRNYSRPGAWREEEKPGSGILYDLGSHLIDQALVLFGLPEAITADLRIQRLDAKVVDNFELILHYKGLKVTLKAGMLVKELLPRFVLFGNEGSFTKYGMDVQEDALKKGLRPGTMSNWGIEPPEIWGTLNTEFKGIHFVGKVESEVGNYARFYQNVYDALVKKEELNVKPLEARNVIRVIELALQSDKEKRTIMYSNK
ncbi:MAG: Gfo/Idh/MocA family oxidoreductase [Ginsengibacter sp.]